MTKVQLEIRTGSNVTTVAEIDLYESDIELHGSYGSIAANGSHLDAAVTNGNATKITSREGTITSTTSSYIDFFVNKTIDASKYYYIQLDQVSGGAITTKFDNSTESTNAKEGGLGGSYSKLNHKTFISTASTAVLYNLSNEIKADFYSISDRETTPSYLRFAGVLAADSQDDLPRRLILGETDVNASDDTLVVLRSQGSEQGVDMIGEQFHFINEIYQQRPRYSGYRNRPSYN